MFYSFKNGKAINGHDNHCKYEIFIILLMTMLTILMTDSNSSDWKLSSFSIAMKNYVNNKKYDDDYGCDYKQVLMILKMM